MRTKTTKTEGHTSADWPLHVAHDLPRLQAIIKELDSDLGHLHSQRPCTQKKKIAVTQKGVHS
jgi:hypothetical protein